MSHIEPLLPPHSTIYNLEIKQVIGQEKHLTLIMVIQKNVMMPDIDLVSVHNKPQTSPTLSKNPMTQQQNSEYAHTQPHTFLLNSNSIAIVAKRTIISEK